MIKAFVFVLVGFISSQALGADFVGKWMSECTEMEGGYTVAVMEFRADGTGLSANDFFSDAQCKNSMANMNFPLTYTADAASFVVTLQVDASATIVLKGSYAVAGDLLTIIPSEISVDGQSEPVDPTLMVLKRTN